MHSEESNPPTTHQPNATPAEVTTTTTPPTHHMNTDSRSSKRTRPISPAPAPSPQPTTAAGQTQGQKKQPTTAAPANKRPNIEKPPRTHAVSNQWDTLRASSTTSTTETSGKRHPLTLPLPLTNALK